MTDQQISLEVVYGTPEKQAILEIMVEPGTTVERAIVASGIVKTEAVNQPDPKWQQKQ